MPTQDTSEVKEKVMSYIESQGPLLPVQIAREVGTSSLFISAYLSELISAKKLKVSKMKVGNSPLYYLPGQDHLLENFSSYLKPQEKRALEQLKEAEVLKDSDLEPATRVALQSVEDFAIPFEHSGEKYWRYMTISEEKAVENLSEKPEYGFVEEIERQASGPESESQEKNSKGVSQEPAIDSNKNQTENQDDEKKSSIQDDQGNPESSEEPKFESPLKSGEKEPKENTGSETTKQKETENREPKAKKKTAKKSASKKSSSDKTNKFFNKVKEQLSEQNIEINDIVGIGKDELVLKINEAGEEKLLIAFNKSKINEDDLIKAYKKASDYDIKYTVLSKGGALKKVENLLEALGKMDSVKSMK